VPDVPVIVPELTDLLVPESDVLLVPVVPVDTEVRLPPDEPTVERDPLYVRLYNAVPSLLWSGREYVVL